MNGLMLAFAFTLPYHAMRAAADAGVKVHVLGDGVSDALRTRDTAPPITGSTAPASRRTLRKSWGRSTALSGCTGSR